MIEQQTYGLEDCGLYYGIYRAQVVRNDDPSSVGRVVVLCPQVHNTTAPEIWAWPKFNGMWRIPDVGDWVYVQFDHGRAEYPMYGGGWWGTGDPTSDMTVKNIVLATPEGMKVVVDRTNKTVLVEQSDGNSILISNGELDIKSDEVDISSGGRVQTLMTNDFLEWFNSEIVPFLQSKGYTGSLAPTTSITTVLKAQ